MAGVDPAVATVVCGHTHMPYARIAHGRLVVNPGSVGMPYGRPGAHWALLTPNGPQLRRTVYDYEAAATRIAAESGFPGAAQWAQEYVRDTCTAEAVVGAWAARDGRSWRGGRERNQLPYVPDDFGLEHGLGNGCAPVKNLCAGGHKTDMGGAFAPAGDCGSASSATRTGDVWKGEHHRCQTRGAGPVRPGTGGFGTCPIHPVCR
jgi:hypothetical protein